MADQIDDEAPKTLRPKPVSLDPLSISDLEAYIGELEAEIERAKRTISTRRAHIGGAEALFKPKS